MKTYTLKNGDERQVGTYRELYPDAPAVDKEHFRLWIAELRSGRHVQGRGLLEQSEQVEAEAGAVTVRRCCLGVVCRTAMAHGLELPVSQEPREPHEYFAKRMVTYFDTHIGTLPPDVMAWLGLPLDSSVYIGITMPAANANDYLRLTFAEIADMIEIFYELEEVQG